MVHLINRKRFIFSNIESRLNEELSPNCIEETLKHQPLPELLNMLLNDSRDAIQCLKSFRYEIPAQDFEQLSQHNYSDLFRMKDRLQLMQASEGFKNLTENALSFYQMLFLSMDTIEHFLESIGIHSLAGHELLPDHFRECRKAVLRQQSLLLLSKCKSRSIDPVLTELLRAHFDAFTSADRMLQQELSFSEQLLSALLQLLDVAPENDYDLLIMNKLISINFNSGECYGYCSGKIKLCLEENSGSKRKLQALNWHLKELKQVLPVSGMALNPAYPQLKVLLLELVLAEISYLELELHGEESSTKSIYNMPRALKTRDPNMPGKIQLQLSQRVLAIWSQTMISMKLIQLGKKGQREITEFLADNFTTAGSEDIHPDNFRRRYKEKHTAGSETLINILEQMISFIKQEYIEIKKGA